MDLITGPYCYLETEMAAWAPKENEHMRAVKFINKLASA